MVLSQEKVLAQSLKSSTKVDPIDTNNEDAANF